MSKFHSNYYRNEFLEILKLGELDLVLSFHISSEGEGNK